MKFTHKNLTDETLLAFILNELDATEASKIRNAAEEDAALAARINSLKEQCSLLENAFDAESKGDDADERLSREREEFLASVFALEQAQRESARKLTFAKLIRWTGGIGIAACLALALAYNSLPTPPEPSFDAALNSREHAETPSLGDEHLGRFASAPISSKENKTDKSKPLLAFSDVDYVYMGAASRNANPSTSPRGEMSEASLSASSSRYTTDSWDVREARKALVTSGVGSAESYDRNTESYAKIANVEFSNVAENPLSTFSIDVDSASYANVRRMLNSGQAVPSDAVRAEEFINYFKYGYENPPSGADTPFSVTGGLARAPWNEKRTLMRVGVKLRDIEWKNRPPSNMVFLVDVSGSMYGEKRLGLVQKSLKMLANKLDARDRIAIVTYASDVRLVLPSTSADNTETIIHAIDSLKSGGGTSGEGGIELAYALAQKGMVKDGINRIIICSDGDFNIGKSSVAELKEIIKEKAKSGVFLSVAGFGMDNYKDDMMESLAHNGNGNYSYIDSEIEARKIFASEAAAKLNCIAKDVKIQVEFNPAKVKSYKLIGYENRKLAAEDFNDDKKDAGDAGAGDSVTAIYEIITADSPEAAISKTDELKYSKTESKQAFSEELATVKIRWKDPEAEVSKKFEYIVKATNEIPEIGKCDEDFRFAVAAAMFALKLRANPELEKTGYAEIKKLARSALGNDESGTRAEFMGLIDKAEKK